MDSSRFSFNARAGLGAATALLLALGLVGANAASATATPLPAPTVIGMTGNRPSATRLTFPISDQVSSSVDVGTGNLEVSTSAMTLPGVVSPVQLTAVFNSMSQITGTTSTPTANKWVAGGGGAGTLTLNSTTGAIVFVAADGGTWSFAAVSGSPTTFTSPAGFQATLAAQLTSGVVTGYTLTYWTSQTVETFDANGLPITIKDRNNNATTFAFASGVPTSIKSSAGPTAARTASVAYNASTYTETVTQTNGSLTRNVQYVKNAASNLTSIVDAMGKTTSFTYTSGNLTQIFSVTGAETDFSYDGSGRVTQIDQHNTTAGSPGTSTTRLTYPSASQTLVAGPDTSTGTAVATGPHITYAIGSGYLVSKATDQVGRERSATYSSTNIAPLTSTSGNTDATPPVGSTPTGTSTNTFGANAGQSQTAAAAPGGSAQTAAYTNTGATAYLPSSTSSDSGDQTVYHYNGSGNQDSSTNSTLAASASLVYNTNGTVSTATAPKNTSPSNPTTYGYDPYTFQLTSITPPTGTSLGSKALTYDGFGRLSNITDGRGNTTTYTYDKMDRMLTTVFSSGLTTVTNTYSNAGQLLTSTSATGTITNTYDQLGRQLTTANTSGGGTETYTYDKASNLITTSDALGTTTNTYDSSGVVIRTAYPHNSSTQNLVYFTDDQGRRTDEFIQSDPTGTYWQGHVHTSYDTSGRVIGLTASTGPAPTTVTPVLDMTYCYNTASAAPTCATGTTTDRSKMVWSKDNLTGQVTTFSYDGGGRLLTMAQSGGTTNNTYTYTYDADGNRLTAVVTGSNPATQTLTYNAANQITTTGYSYDGAGNLTAAPSTTYTYNAAQQMTQAVVAGVTTTYTYAGASQKEVLTETTGGAHAVTTTLTYGKADAQGNPEIQQYNRSGAQAYVLPDPVTGQALMIVTSNDQDGLLVFDGLNNPVALLTSGANNSFSLSYDPWGVQVLTAGGVGQGVYQNPYAFHAGIKDPGSGLVKFGLRWYNPTTGTWTQQDTLDAPLDTANANRYAYAGDDPINGYDPTGFGACATTAFVLGAISLVAAGAALVIASVATGGAAAALAVGALGAISFSTGVPSLLLAGVAAFGSGCS